MRLVPSLALLALCACAATPVAPPASGDPDPAATPWDDDDDSPADNPSQQGGADEPGGPERTFVNDFLDGPSDPSIGCDLDRY